MRRQVRTWEAGLFLISAIGICGLAFAQVKGSISVSREIRVPTRYEEQSTANWVGGLDAYRPPIPTEFETRVDGVRQSSIATVESGPRMVRQYKTPDGKILPAFSVKFYTGETAIFVQGKVTTVRGVRYLGIGPDADGFRVRNLETGEYLRFRG